MGGILPRKKIGINENLGDFDSKSSRLVIDENGNYFIYALLQKCDAENKNGRIYPRHVLEREVDNYMEMAKNTRNAIGECDHPEESVIMLKNSCHRIVECWWEGDELFGKVELLVSRPYKENGSLQNDADRIAMLIEDYDVVIGISSRGVGSLNQRNGKNIVDDDYELICWDLVHTPSTFNAYAFGEGEKPKYENKTTEKTLVENKALNKFMKFMD